MSNGSAGLWMLLAYSLQSSHQIAASHIMTATLLPMLKICTLNVPVSRTQKLLWLSKCTNVAAACTLMPCMALHNNSSSAHLQDQHHLSGQSTESESSPAQAHVQMQQLLAFGAIVYKAAWQQLL